MCFGRPATSDKGAQCPKGRSAETGLKDREAPELVTGDFFAEDWPSGPRRSLAKRESTKVDSRVRIPYLPPFVLQAVRQAGPRRRVLIPTFGGSNPSRPAHYFLALAQSGIRASAYEAEGRKFKSFTRGHLIFHFLVC